MIASHLRTACLLALPFGCDADPPEARDLVQWNDEDPATEEDPGREPVAPVESDPPRRAHSAGDRDPDPVCDEHAACFSWCGTRFTDGACYRSEPVELDAEAFGPLLCEPLVIEVDRGEARLAEGSTDRDARCFLQVLRYGHVGVAELFWRDAGSSQWGHLVVQGSGTQYARIEMRVEETQPDCGDAITLSAPAAHVKAERDPHFDTCLDTTEDVDLARCVLGPAAAFYDDHDWIYDVAFPWLSGSCGVP